jgi:hypothetical protein
MEVVISRSIEMKTAGRRVTVGLRAIRAPNQTRYRPSELSGAPPDLMDSNQMHVPPRLCFLSADHFLYHPPRGHPEKPFDIHVAPPCR